MIFAPFFFLYVALLFAALVLLFALIQVHLIAYALQHAGLTPGQAFTVLLLSLLGSYVNIPVWRSRAHEVETVELVSYFGVRYRVPIHLRREQTVIAVNFGGAVLPTLVSFYLMAREPAMVLPGLLAVAAVAFVANRFAKPLRGVGIAMPMFVAPLAAAGSALVLHALIPGDYDTSAVAYVAGTMGTLIGADLMNLDKVSKLGAPVASIGGAGTFDGIFLSGLIAALLA